MDRIALGNFVGSTAGMILAACGWIFLLREVSCSVTFVFGSSTKVFTNNLLFFLCRHAAFTIYCGELLNRFNFGQNFDHKRVRQFGVAFLNGDFLSIRVGPIEQADHCGGPPRIVRAGSRYNQVKLVIEKEFAPGAFVNDAGSLSQPGASMALQAAVILSAVALTNLPAGLRMLACEI